MGIFRREKKSEIGQQVATAIATSDNARPQSSQDALDQTLGIGKLLLSDEGTERLITALTMVQEKDESGTVKNYLKPTFAALRIQSGYTPRASRLDPIDVEIGIREGTCIFRRAKMNMTEAEYESGAALIADAILNAVVIPNYLSANKGFLAKLTKVSPRSMEVTYREGKKEREGFTP